MFGTQPSPLHSFTVPQWAFQCGSVCLIADDNESVRKMLRSFVEQQPGIEVCAMTENGTETVDRALALRPDLVILDVKMPGLNGVEVA